VIEYTSLVRTRVIITEYHLSWIQNGFLYFGCSFSMWLVIYPCVACKSVYTYRMKREHISYVHKIVLWSHAWNFQVFSDNADMSHGRLTAKLNNAEPEILCRFKINGPWTQRESHWTAWRGSPSCYLTEQPRVSVVCEQPKTHKTNLISEWDLLQLKTLKHVGVVCPFLSFSL
jgi:hypothetical protein